MEKDPNTRPPGHQDEAPTSPSSGSSGDIYGGAGAGAGAAGTGDTVHLTKAALSPDALVQHLRGRDMDSRYESRGEIARGGMGAVLRIWDKNLDRPLAMKVILGQAERAGDTPPAETAKVARFLEDAQVTGQLDHPGIVPVHELGLDPGGRVYFTMRLVKGRDFSEILQEVGKSEEWTLARALEVLLKVCDAMAYAHDKGVIHRDLKPANIRVGRFGEVYVMDWGLARVLGEDDRRDIRLREIDSTVAVATDRSRSREEAPDTPLVTMDGDVVGTPAYMPPEQARGEVEAVDQRSDVYALGAILYHLLAGQMPYVPTGARISSRTVLMRVIEGPPKPVRQVAPTTPDELAAICEKAMARGQADRYAGTEELAEDLRRFLENRPITARPPSLGYVLRLAIARHKGLAATIAVATVLLIASVTTAFVLVNNSRRDAIAEEKLANDRLSAFERMADVKRLRDRIREADENLWPAHPSKVEAMKTWLAKSEEMLSRLDLHRAERDRLRTEEALPFDGKPEEHPRFGELADLRTKRSEADETLVDLEGRFPEPTEEIAKVKEAMSALHEHISELETTVTERFEWTFADDEAQWIHDTVAGLVAGLEAFAKPSTEGETGGALESVRDRLELAQSIERETIATHRAAWDEAIASIRNRDECPQYDGLVLTEQIGLVPIGRDPDSGLWEFGLWKQTGEIPVRGDDGGLILEERSGMVLVLIPGGTFTMGSPPGEKDRQPNERQHEVTLAPFLLSKYEMTQGQWESFAGENPSYYGPHNYRANLDRLPADEKALGLHPVEQVDWNDCDRVLRELGLVLPTEAQWEYAARAGTTTAWWPGETVQDLEGAENILDQYARQNGAPATWGIPEKIDDGFVVHGPVGRHRPNAFGLHDVLGNVREWCRDEYGDYRLPVNPGDGERLLQSPARDRVIRGGCFLISASLARSADRFSHAPEFRDDILGVRPSRVITTPP